MDNSARSSPSIKMLTPSTISKRTFTNRQAPDQETRTILKPNNARAPAFAIDTSRISESSIRQNCPNWDIAKDTNITTATPGENLNVIAPVASVTITNEIDNGLKKNIGPVDSALLSAMKDPRERLALLKLEKILVEFMNDNTISFMEVGGPYNTIIVRGSGVGNGEEGELNGNLNVSGKIQISNNVTDQGGRQTSFQRLCLHRLADRFNIIREAGVTVLEGNSNNPALIRLVKVKNSKIPEKLLINMDLSKSIDDTAKNNCLVSRNRIALGNESILPQDKGDFPVNEEIISGLVGRFSTSSLKDTVIYSGGPASGKRNKKKVMIMKRHSSNKGSSGSLNSKGNDSNIENGSKKLKGKNLSDKEKAYAEARARIFNKSQSSTTSAPVVSKDHDQAGIESQPESLPSPPDKSEKSSPPTLNDHHPVVSAFKNLNSSSDSVISVPLPIAAENVNPAGSVDDLVMSASNSFNNLPAAATGGGASKVTWRNRRQEESDPDFRRGRHSLVVPSLPVAPLLPHSSISYHHHHFSPGNVLVGGTMSPQQNLSPQHVSNYHYSNVIDGQSMGYGNATVPLYQQASAVLPSQQSSYQANVGNSLWKNQGIDSSSHSNGGFATHPQRKEQQKSQELQQNASHKNDDFAKMKTSPVCENEFDRNENSWTMPKIGDIPALYNTEDFPALG